MAVVRSTRVVYNIVYILYNIVYILYMYNLW